LYHDPDLLGSAVMVVGDRVVSAVEQITGTDSIFDGRVADDPE
jgi:hypothetical protein